MSPTARLEFRINQSINQSIKQLPKKESAAYSKNNNLLSLTNPLCAVDTLNTYTLDMSKIIVLSRNRIPKHTNKAPPPLLPANSIDPLTA
jgi:hypothetical protein